MNNLTKSTYFNIRPLFLTLILFVNALALIMVPAHNAWAKSNPRYGSIVIDADTGAVISEDRADKKLHPASLTKIMTLLMVFEAVEQGKMSLNDNITISRHAAGMVPSKLGLPAGSKIRVKDAIFALVTKSANDIAAAVAEHIGGTEYGFARLMTKRAHEIGMRNTNFVNASGLHDPSQITTPRDMAQLARFVIVQYPEYYRYFSTTNFTYQGKSYHNHNRLMSSYKGMDGMKTGYVGASGFNLVASAVRNNRRIIGVVFGGYTSQSRNAHMAKLLDAAWGEKGDVRVAAALPEARSALAPLPQRKPGIGNLIAQLDSVLPASGEALAAQALKPSDTQTPSLLASNYKPPLQAGFDRLIGEGDYDPASYKRIQTGLMAVASVKNANGQAAPDNLHQTLQTAAQVNAVDTGDAPLLKKVSLTPPAKIQSGQPWSVQIGAFKSRVATDKAIQSALKSLPAPYSQAQPLIAPLKAGNSWLFRARLTGYTQSEAMAACKILPDCLPVAPVN